MLAKGATSSRAAAHDRRNVLPSKGLPRGDPPVSEGGHSLRRPALAGGALLETEKPTNNSPSGPTPPKLMNGSGSNSLTIPPPPKRKRGSTRSRSNRPTTVSPHRPRPARERLNPSALPCHGDVAVARTIEISLRRLPSRESASSGKDPVHGTNRVVGLEGLPPASAGKGRAGVLALAVVVLTGAAEAGGGAHLDPDVLWNQVPARHPRDGLV